MQEVKVSQEDGQKDSEEIEGTDIELEMTHLRHGEASGTTVEEEGQLDALCLSQQAVYVKTEHQ